MSQGIPYTRGLGNLLAGELGLTVDGQSGVDCPSSKIAFGAAGTYTYASATNPLPVTEYASSPPSSTTLQNAVSATGNGTNMPVTGYATAVLQVSGTFSATVNFEGSADGGTTWVPISGAQFGFDIFANSTTTTGDWRFDVTGLTHIRGRVTWTSGTSVTVTGYASFQAGPIKEVRAALYDASGNVLNSTSGALNVAIQSLPIGVTPNTRTSGGATSYSLIAASGTNANNVKGSAGTLYKISCSNIGAAAVWLKIYNTSGTPTAGSGTPALRIMIPGNTAGAGTNIDLGDIGVAFSSGIGITVTGGIADADTTSVSASNIIVNLAYA